MRKTCILVGNAPLKADISAAIDAAGYVFRFNKTRNFGLNGGTRTDALMMITTNIGRYSRKDGCYKIFHNTDFANSAPVKAAKRIIFPVNPQIIKQYYHSLSQGPSLFSQFFRGKKLDWTDRLIELLGKEKEITILSAEFYLQAAREIGIMGDRLSCFFPSTGFICLNYCFKRFDPEEWQIKLCGFTWQGWERHLWNAEKQWILHKQEEGALSFL